MNPTEMSEFVPQELVNQIKAIQLPGLAFHGDHNGKDAHLEMMLRMQLCELYFATTYYECVTNMVGERLVQLPSTRVLSAIADRQFGEDAISFMKDIPDKGIFCLFTWSAL